MASDDDDRPRRRRPAPDDDDDRPRRRESRGSDDGGVGYVIPYKNGTALAAYYVAIFGLILCVLPPLSLVSGVAAMVLGAMGLRRASQNPEAHGSAHAYVGIIVGLVQVLGACGVIGFVIYAIAVKK